MPSPDQSAPAPRATTRSLAAMRQAAACRFSTPASPTTIALQAWRTAGSSAALRLTSGPMPAGSPAAMAIRVLSRMRGHPASISAASHRCARGPFTSTGKAKRGCRRARPRQERSVDHVGDALAAHRLDGEIHVFEPESVGRDLLQREALRGKLREGELARLEAVAARALDGDELHRDLLEREIGELLHLT